VAHSDIRRTLSVRERRRFDCAATFVHFPAAAGNLRIVRSWWKLCLIPAAQESTHSRAENALLNRRSATACFFDAQALRHEAKKWPTIFLQAVDGHACTEEIVQPELIVEPESKVEEGGFPRTRVTTSKLLVATDARRGTINFWKRALARDAAFDTDARTERVTNACQFTSLVQAEVPGF